MNQDLEASLENVRDLKRVIEISRRNTAHYEWELEKAEQTVKKFRLKENALKQGVAK